MGVTYFRSDGWVKTSQGPAVPGAQVFVCTQPADVVDYPPSPLAAIYSDNQGLFPITQPILTDGFGHYNYYAASGTYTEVIAYSGVVQQVYPDQTLGAVIASGLLILNNPVQNPNFNDTLPSAPVGYTNALWQTSGGYVSVCVPVGGHTIEINGSVIPGTTVNFNNSTPSAPGNYTNVLWQTDGNGNISAYVPTLSVPAGQSIILSGFPNFALKLGQIAYTTNVGTANTCCQQMPQDSLLCYPSKSKITVHVNASSGTFTVGSFTLARTLPGSLTVIDFTTITFGGSATPTLSIGFNISDVINLQIDSQHDYWFLCFGVSGIQQILFDAYSVGFGVPFYGGYMGTGVADLTHASPIQNPPVPSGFIRAWIHDWQAA